MTGNKTKRPAEPFPHSMAGADPQWRTREVAFAKSSAEEITRRKASKVWERTGPGAWLTQSRPGGVLATLPVDDTDVDDVPHITGPGDTA